MLYFFRGSNHGGDRLAWRWKPCFCDRDVSLLYSSTTLATIHVQVRGRFADGEGHGGRGLHRLEGNQAGVLRDATPGGAQGVRLAGSQLRRRD